MVDATFSSYDGSLMHRKDDVEETGNLGADLLSDLDSYLNDINDRLTISRMVSDSVIKGMARAVEEEAAEKMALKELELDRLKQILQLYRMGSDMNGSLETCHNEKTVRHGFYASYSDALSDHDRSLEYFDLVNGEAQDLIRNLKKEIDKIKRSSPIRRKNSASEVLGLGGILQEKVSDKWIDLDRMLDGLKAILDSAHKQAYNMIHMSKSSLLKWQQDCECQVETERMVTKICFQGLEQEFGKMWRDQNAEDNGDVSAMRFAKIKEISSLRSELNVISKSLFVPEDGQLVSHRSLEHRKASGNHFSSTALWEENDKHDNSMITLETLELAQLSHLSNEELFNYLKSEMTKMKRHHESKVQEMTEEYFSLKGEYLKERESSLLVRRDKELLTLRKMIPEIICKLDEILLENEKSPALSYSSDNLENLSSKLKLLYSENCILRDLLTDKKNEIEYLASQVYDAKEKISAHSVVKANLSKMIVDMNDATEDERIETSIREDLYKFLLKEVICQIESYSQELVMENNIMVGIYDIIFTEAAHTVEPPSKLEIEDSDLEQFIMLGVYEVILGKTLKEAMEKFRNLSFKHANESEYRLNLEFEVLEKEKALRLSLEQRKNLEQEILSLTANIDEKDRLLQGLSIALAKEKEKFEVASLELDKLRAQRNQQQMCILKCNEESETIKANFAKALKKIELYEGEIWNLRETLELITENLRVTAREKNMLLVMSEEKQSLIETRENEHRKLVDSISILIHGLSRAVMAFESRATEDIKRNSARLEYLGLQFPSLMQKADKLGRMGIQCKERLEKRCSDLQKAEAEVDLLGDEVDTLLSLLKKIYIALDHYSPILQHYPGITQILKLIRRELSGDA